MQIPTVHKSCNVFPLLNMLQESTNKHFILSIDLGIKNLGYAVIEYTKTGPKTLEDLTVSFGIFNIEEQFKRKIDIVNNRCGAVLKFFTNMLETHGKFDRVIIERQVNRNTMAMELMYACAMACKVLCNIDMINFDPKDKFLKLGLPYSTTKKAHKKLSTYMARALISTQWPTMIKHFESHPKKDDISDALNQALTWMLVNGFIKYSVNEYVRLLDLRVHLPIGANETNDEEDSKDGSE